MTDVEVQLRDLAAWVDWPEPADDLADRVLARLEPRRSRPVLLARPWLAAAAAVVAVLAVVVAVPGPRHAVADWLGLAAVRITVGEANEPEQPIGLSLGLGRRVALDDVDAPIPGALGEPDEAWRRGSEVSLVWRTPGRPIILTSLPADVVPLRKQVRDGTQVRIVEVNGTEGWWIAGDHVVTRSGEPPARAGRVLLWEVDGTTYRLESGLTLEEALRVARSLD